MRPIRAVYNDEMHELDHREAVNAITRLELIANSLFDVVYFTVAVAGTEVAVPHALGAVPASFVQVTLQHPIRGKPTGTGAVANGTTAWSATNVYLTASVAGTYAAIIRR